MMKKLMRVFLKSVLCGVLPLGLLLSGFSVAAYTGNSNEKLTDGADIRVMSYNVLVDNDESLGGWSWGKPLADRGDKASAAINHYRPDVIGFQECNYKWHVSLRENLPDYDFVNADVPEVQWLEDKKSLGQKDWMCTTMMYNTKTLELVENELIGYSCNYWGCIQRMRYISMALFKVKATGETFVFTSTHFDAERDAKGQGMRRTQANELADRILYYMDTYGCPVISTGDYNSGYNDEPITIVREKTGMISHNKNRGGIDYILYSAGVSAKYFTVVDDTDLGGASDHQPIFGDFELKDGFRFTTTTTTTEPSTTTTTTTTTMTTETTTEPTTTTSAAQTTSHTIFKPTAVTRTEKTTTTTAQKTTTTRQSATTSATQTAAPTISTTSSTTVIKTTAKTTQTTWKGSVAAPTESTTTAAEDTTTLSEDTTTTLATTTTTTASAMQPEAEDTPVEAKPVPKRNDKLLFIGIGVAVAAIGAAVTALLLRKKK